MRGEIDSYPLTARFLMGRLRHAMSEREKEILESSIEEVREYDQSHTVLERGKLCDFSTMLVSGFAIRTIHENNNRYIVGIQVPGDFMDLHAFALKRLDHDLVTLGPTKIGLVSHKRLQELMQGEPHLSRLFWFSTLLDAAIHRQWTLKLQQLKASRRTAHLLAEIWHRFDQVGLANPTGFRSPLTQSDLADMCGTTPIHMNRSLGELRRKGLADFRRGKLVCNDRAALEQMGDFDPTYLYGEGDLFMGDVMSFPA
ncbi:Crp/Fnr family transcriptional regulator [Erythrobacter sp. HKB08]|uniref:Crp/Fnr family transcriptional regulator n=1 Tax=Erythrobacter sp. HKB08 TaxID=2502843 RepID=UPI001008B9FE|nr:Crp/Fnr family transcriptional regulator [Erythrobacter sp. HKB08]